MTPIKIKKVKRLAEINVKDSFAFKGNPVTINNKIVTLFSFKTKE